MIQIRLVLKIPDFRTIQICRAAGGALSRRRVAPRYASVGEGVTQRRERGVGYIWVPARYELAYGHATCYDTKRPCGPEVPLYEG